MAISFHETQETIGILRRVADKLDKEHGCITADELWKGVQCEPSAVQHSNPTITRQGFRQMEGFLDVLQTLASTFESHISFVRARVHTPRLTLDNLPDEIIPEILGYEDMGLRKEDMKHRKLALKLPLRYSHICFRFRNAILSLHSLWAKIPLGLDLSAPIIETIVRGSGTLGLTANVDGCWIDETQHHTYRPYSSHRGSRNFSDTGLRSTYVQATLDVIFKYGERWTGANFMVYDPQSSQYIEKHPSYADLTLSSLRTLKVTDISGKMAHFFRNWTLPHLEELDWSNSRTLPLSLRSCTSVPRLSICSLDILEPELMDIVAFLAANPSLTRLKLRFGMLKDSDLNEPAEPQAASLPNLDHFEFECWMLSTTDAITKLLPSISCPGIRHLSFLTHDSYAGLVQHIRGRYPTLTSVTLNINRPVHIFFDEILCSFPNTIEKVKIIEGDLCSSQTEGTVHPRAYTSYPNLKDLDLEESTPKEEGFYTNLSDILKKFCVTLDHFRPCCRRRADAVITEAERIDAIKTLHSAGVLVESSLT